MFFRKLQCSFCRRSDKDVAKLVAGASGYICDTCAREAVRIMETPAPRTTTAHSPNVLQERASGWNRMWHFASAVD